MHLALVQMLVVGCGGGGGGGGGGWWGNEGVGGATLGRIASAVTRGGLRR